MKKNRWMRLASLLLIICLITTCTVTGTYAKYTTQDSAFDIARVAKWGVELQVVGNLYGTNYRNVGNGNVATTGTANISVQGTQIADTNVVAPGTLNDKGLDFSLNGKPEVSSLVRAQLYTANIYLAAGSWGVMVPATNLTAGGFAKVASTGELYWFDTSDSTYKPVPTSAVEADFVTYSTLALFTLEDAVGLAKTYYPVVYELNGSTSVHDGDIAAAQSDKDVTAETTVDTLTDIADAVTTQLKGPSAPASAITTTASADGVFTKWVVESQEYLPNTDLTNIIVLGKEELTWEWCYDRDADGYSGNSACVACKADTILGNLMGGTIESGVVGISGSAPEGIVVYRNSTTNAYTAVDYANATTTVYDIDNPANTEVLEYYYVTCDGYDTVACLSTFFAIDIDVTQID